MILKLFGKNKRPFWQEISESTHPKMAEIANSAAGLLGDFGAFAQQKY